MSFANFDPNASAPEYQVFKETFDSLIDATTNFYPFQKAHPFDQRLRIGRKNVASVKRTRSQGTTLAGPLDDSGDITGNTLVDPVSAKFDRTEIVSSEITQSEAITWKNRLASRGNGQYAFTDLMADHVEAVVDGHAFKRELLFLNGQSTTGIGVVTAVEGAGAGGYIDLSTFPEGRWFMSEGMQLTILSSDLATKRTGASTDSKTDAVNTAFYVVNGFNPDNDRLVLDNDQNIQVGDVLFLRGAVTAAATPVWHCTPGLEKWLAITAADTFQGVDGGENDSWVSPSVSSSSGSLRYDHYLEAGEKLSDRGGSGKYESYIPTAALSDLISDLTSTVRRSPRSTTLELGGEKIKFVCGGITFDPMVHPYMDPDKAYDLPMEGRGKFRVGGIAKPDFVGEGGSPAELTGVYWNSAGGRQKYHTLDYHSDEFAKTNIPARSLKHVDIVSGA